MCCTTFGALCGQLGYVVPSPKTVDSLGFPHSPHHIIFFILVGFDTPKLASALFGFVNSYF